MMMVIAVMVMGAVSMPMTPVTGRLAVDPRLALAASADAAHQAYRPCLLIALISPARLWIIIVRARG